jgi:hypothetical protein
MRIFGIWSSLPKLLRICRSFFGSRWNSFSSAGVVVVAGVDDLGILGRQELIERVLVVGAGFAVHADEEGLVAERLDVLAVVLGDELRHLAGCAPCP